MKKYFHSSENQSDEKIEGEGSNEKNKKFSVSSKPTLRIFSSL